MNEIINSLKIGDEISFNYMILGIGKPVSIEVIDIVGPRSNRVTNSTFILGRDIMTKVVADYKVYRMRDISKVINKGERPKPIEPFSTEINKGDIISFDYVNYKGVKARRRVKVGGYFFGHNQYHPDTQFFMAGIDLDKNLPRGFAIKDMSRVTKEPVPVPNEVFVVVDSYGDTFNLDTFLEADAKYQSALSDREEYETTEEVLLAKVIKRAYLVPDKERLKESDPKEHGYDSWVKWEEVEYE